MPCYKIFETEHSLAFLDAFPITPGHSLLVPKATVCPKKYMPTYRVLHVVMKVA